MREWIEILFGCFLSLGKATVLPRMREWIEMDVKDMLRFCAAVLPRMREWIEMTIKALSMARWKVLPRMREWIEITCK